MAMELRLLLEYGTLTYQHTIHVTVEYVSECLK